MSKRSKPGQYREPRTTVAIPRDLGRWMLEQAARETIATGRQVTMTGLAVKAIVAYRMSIEEEQANG